MTASTKVLLADSDAHLLTSLGIRLEVVGFHVIRVRNPQRVVDRCVCEKPSLLLVDADMPVSPGTSVHEHLGHTCGCSKIPVIYMADRRHLDIERRSLRTHSSTLIYKPVRFNELMRVIWGMLGVNHGLMEEIA